MYRSTVPSPKNHVWTSLMRKHWRIWWTPPHTQAGDQWDSGPTRPAPSLAFVRSTAKQTHNLSPSLARLTRVVCFQSRPVRKPLVLSQEWWPCSSRLKCVPQSSAFPGLPWPDRLPLPTPTMEGIARTLTGSSTSTVRFIFPNKAIIPELRNLHVQY